MGTKAWKTLAGGLSRGGREQVRAGEGPGEAGVEDPAGGAFDLALRAAGALEGSRWQVT